MSRYLHHVTLTTGHTRRTWRHEIEPDLMPTLIALVRAACEPGGAPIPGVEPPCRLLIDDRGRCARATVATIDTEDPIITFGIATHSRCGARLWRELHETVMPVQTVADEWPVEPWCAVRLDPGATLYMPPHPLLPVLADLERCVAWAWMEMRNAQSDA